MSYHRILHVRPRKRGAEEHYQKIPYVPIFDRIQKQNVGTLGIHAKHTQNSPHELIGAKLPSCFQSVFSSGGLHICRLSCRAAGLSANRTAPLYAIYVSKSFYFNLTKHKRHCPVVSAGVVICLKEREHYCTT